MVVVVVVVVVGGGGGVTGRKVLPSIVARWSRPITTDESVIYSSTNNSLWSRNM